MYNELVKVTKKKQIHDTENKLVVTSEEKGRGRRRGKREAGKGRPRPLGVRRLRTHCLTRGPQTQFLTSVNGE